MKTKLAWRIVKLNTPIGSYKTYYDNGQLKDDFYFTKGGKRHRQWDTYYENGEIWLTRKYRRNALIDTSMEWYSNGNLHYSTPYTKKPKALKKVWFANGILYQIIEIKSQKIIYDYLKDNICRELEGYCCLCHDYEFPEYIDTDDDEGHNYPYRFRARF